MKCAKTVPKGEDGNNDSSSPNLNALYKYDFVLNNYTEQEVCQLKLTLAKICKKAIFGFEIGEEEGTPHLQGYMSLIRKERYTGLHKYPGLERASFRKCRNERDLITYCRKDGNFWEHGFPKKYVVEIENFFPWELEIIDILKTEPDSRTIRWYWEPNGCAGKTTFQKYIYTHFPDVIVCGGKSADMKNCIVEYQKQNNKLPCIVLINLPKTQELDYFSYTGVEEVKDMFFYSGKYEGGMICGKNPHIIIFANEPPQSHKMALDRWVIKKIN